MKAGLTVPTFQLYAYPGRDHACGRESGKHFDQADALKAGTTGRRTVSRETFWQEV